MKKRISVICRIVGWLFMSTLVLFFAGTCTPGEPERPNIIIILYDDMGYSDLGCYGGEIETPNIDRLANAGARFTQFYNSARCCPTRASLMTGLYPGQAGIGNFTYERVSETTEEGKQRGNLGFLTRECVTLAEVLGSAGYNTYGVGKWHMHRLTGPVIRGFDEYYGYVTGYAADQWTPEEYLRLPQGRKPELSYVPGEFYATDVFSDYAIEFLDQAHQKEQPWFLYLAHSSPHFPIQAPKATVDYYYERYLTGWDKLREERFARQKEIGLAEESWKLTGRSMVPVDEVAGEYSGKPNPVWDSFPENRQKDLARRMAIFAAMIHHVDQGVGRIIDDLEKRGTLNNTLILITSDNGACYEWDPLGFDGPSRKMVKVLHEGEMLDSMGQAGTYHSVGSAWSNLSNTPFRLYKHFTHEGGICSPMIMHWPEGIGTKGRWVRSPGHVMDVMFTLCEVSGAEYPVEFNGNVIIPTEGQSLLPTAKGNKVKPRTLGFDHQGAHAWRDGDWKLVWGKRMPTEPKWELYNIAEDRCETVDLAGKYPGHVEKMSRDWEEWAKRTLVHLQQNR